MDMRVSNLVKNRESGPLDVGDRDDIALIVQRK
jgi:hypothetical protein